MDDTYRFPGFGPADILVPQGCDLRLWSVVACDQYTSEPAYWEQVERLVGGAPSALRLTLPEIYLKGDVSERIGAIGRAMRDYLNRGLFAAYPDSMVLVERTLSSGRVRRGLVGAVDLEAYDYRRGAQSPVRATEGTVLERIPPRVRVRENAPLELPHVMLLADDPGRTVLEPLAERAGEFPLLYDFDLMQGGGHIAGRLIAGETLKGVSRALSALADPRVFSEKYGVSGRAPLVFAAGDGNHSLATAKACWEQVKRTASADAASADALPAGSLPGGAPHPARYALAELVNLHDPALEFEPIHRVAFGVEPERLLTEFQAFYPSAVEGEAAGQRIGYVHAGGRGVLTVQEPPCNLAVGTLQNFLDSYLKEHGGRVDYIHGNGVAEKLGAQPGSVGFLLPAMEKSELFRTVVLEGALPRKTFSMGRACDKRFYLEARRIRPQ